MPARVLPLRRYVLRRERSSPSRSRKKSTNEPYHGQQVSSYFVHPSPRTRTLRFCLRQSESSRTPSGSAWRRFIVRRSNFKRSMYVCTFNLVSLFDIASVPQTITPHQKRPVAIPWARSSSDVPLFYLRRFCGASKLSSTCNPQKKKR